MAVRVINRQPHGTRRRSDNNVINRRAKIGEQPNCNNEVVDAICQATV